MEPHNLVRVCMYCGKETEFWETVSQIPQDISPQDFILNNLYCFNGTKLGKDDYVCTYHEDCFRLKYLSLKRGMTFAREYSYRGSTNKSCGKCGTNRSNLTFRAIANMSTGLKDFIVNQTTSSKPSTRSGSGLGEGNFLCSSCYQIARKKYDACIVGTTYSPQKKLSSDSYKSSELSKPDQETIEGVKDCCVFCVHKFEFTSTQQNVTENVKADINLLNINGVELKRICLNGRFIHSKCRKDLRTAVKKYKKCLKCQKPLHKAPRTGSSAASVQISPQIMEKIQYFRRKAGIPIKDAEYQLEIHKVCNEELYTIELTESDDESLVSITDMSAPEEIETMETDELTSILDSLFQSFFQELLKRLQNNEPIIVAKAFEEINDLIFCESERIDREIPEVSTRDFYRELEERVLQSEAGVGKYIDANKEGAMLYLQSWDMLKIIQTLTKYKQEHQEQNNNDDILVLDTPSGVTASEIMHVLQEVRSRIKDSAKVCEIYARYPELLQNLSFESLLIGQEVFLTEMGYIEIPGVDPVLFNILYFLTCTDDQASHFQLSFPGWDTLYLEGFTENSRPFYCQTLTLLFDILHIRNNDNCYPLHIMLSDLIATSSPYDLMDSLSRIRKCASPSAYFNFKNTMASLVKSMKDAGNVPGLINDMFSFVHIDNLEQYQRHSRDPTTALQHSLIIGVQQPRVGTNIAENEQSKITMYQSLEPRSKRPSLSYHPTHEEIPSYTAPLETTQETRRCNEDDFTYTSEIDKSNMETMKVQLLLHALERTLGAEGENQVVPSLKEVLAWDSKKVSHTNSVYLELIPEKPDCKETILYALSLLEELFVTKLGYKHVVVCGDGVTVNLLYQIKDEYGEAMSWLVVMLGSWHTLKDYLRIIFKKYRHAFIQPVLEECFSGNTLNGIIGVSQWERSHNLGTYIFEALLRLLVERFVSIENENIKILKEEIMSSIDLLRKENLCKEDVETFCKARKVSLLKIAELLPALSENVLGNSKDDEVFTFFNNVLDDFLVYMMLYIAIRSGDWSLRLTSLKMMAERFVTSGATLYQWIVIRHLADLSTTFPRNVLDIFHQGGWVSVLKDGQMVSLARDEFHERTASKDIQLLMPRNQTKQNMEVVCHYLTVSAQIRSCLLEKILDKKQESPFFSKRCNKGFLREQESYVSKFQKKLATAAPFKGNERKLVKPFTEQIAKSTIRDDMINSQSIGHEMVLAYVKQRFCSYQHPISSEKQRMKRKLLSLFTSDKKPKSKPSREKVQRQVLEVMVAGVIKLSQGETENDSLKNFVGSQISKLPLLWCEPDGKPYFNNNKTGFRAWLEKRYPSAFSGTHEVRKDRALIIRDALQDVMLQPKGRDSTFKDYFELFWTVKVKYSFLRAKGVCLVFDKQERGISTKDLTRVRRDDKSESHCADVEITDDTLIPTNNSWAEFLANRNNKKRLVEYLVEKMKYQQNRLNETEILLLNEGIAAWKVVKGKEAEVMPRIDCNEEEADTIMFNVALTTEFDSYLIRSTDSDVLFVSLINECALRSKNIVIQYNVVSSAPKYVNCKELVQAINNDTTPQISLVINQGKPVAQLIGLLHFITGCDDLPHMRHISKLQCSNALVRYIDFIFPRHMDICVLFSLDPEYQLESLHFYVRFLASVYRHKYSSCFTSKESLSELMLDNNGRESYRSLLDKVRKKTWHRTVIDQNTLPTFEAIAFHSLRCTLTLHRISTSYIPIHETLDLDSWGWQVSTFDGIAIPTPVWDTEENKQKFDLIVQSTLQKCGCKKSKCDPTKKMCKCVRKVALCSSLCTCVGCKNNDSTNLADTVTEDEQESSSTNSEASTDTEE